MKNFIMGVTPSHAKITVLVKAFVAMFFVLCLSAYDVKAQGEIWGANVVCAGSRVQYELNYQFCNGVSWNVVGGRIEGYFGINGRIILVDWDYPAPANASVSVSASSCWIGIEDVSVTKTIRVINPFNGNFPISGSNSVYCGTNQVVSYSAPLNGLSSSYNWSTPSGWELIDGQGTARATYNANGIGGMITLAITQCDGTVYANKIVTATQLV